MKPVTIDTLLSKKQAGTPITMVTAYDAPTARLLSESGIDIALVGDTLGMVIQGGGNTLSVTIEEILYHTKMVRRGLDGPLLVGDMPFLSYQISEEEGHRNAGRLIKEGGAQAIKLEGGEEIAGLVHRLTRSMIPVIGHIGMKPQAVHQMGGFKVQGRDLQGRERIINDARALLDAGVFALLLEAIPPSLAREITELSPMPTIGIGAGPATDGQVLVFHDLVGWSVAPLPRFVRSFGDVGTNALNALAKFKEAVSTRNYPSTDESYPEKGATPPPINRIKSKRKG
ncbi:MAG: 3-methyl-2-oxobutanoate hydroxymethyltransferase [Leptospirales bacterium]